MPSNEYICPKCGEKCLDVRYVKENNGQLFITLFNNPVNREYLKITSMCGYSWEEPCRDSTKSESEGTKGPLYG